MSTVGSTVRAGVVGIRRTGLDLQSDLISHNKGDLEVQVDFIAKELVFFRTAWKAWAWMF